MHFLQFVVFCASEIHAYCIFKYHFAGVSSLSLPMPPSQSSSHLSAASDSDSGCCYTASAALHSNSFTVFYRSPFIPPNPHLMMFSESRMQVNSITYVVCLPACLMAVVGVGVQCSKRAKWKVFLLNPPDIYKQANKQNLQCKKWQKSVCWHSFWLCTSAYMHIHINVCLEERNIIYDDWNLMGKCKYSSPLCSHSARIRRFASVRRAN